METMSVSELIKTAIPLNSAQSDSANIICGSGTIVKSVSSPSTPIRTRNAVAPPAGTSCTSNNDTVQKGKGLPKNRDEFFKDLQQFHEKRGTPCTHLPKISGKTIDLHKLYNEVIERGGFAKVNNRDEWDEIIPELGFKDKCVNASAAIKHFYRRFLDKYERLNFFGEDPDKVDAADVSDTNDGGRLRRFFTSALGGAGGPVNTVPMSYNYRQHIVNMDRRRIYKLSMDLYKPSPYEKLMLSLLSPLPNEQDFAINVCTLMANESKHTLKINEYPKLLDVLLAHTGVFSDHSLRELFQYVYKEVRQNSLLEFWHDLLYNKPQILQLYSSDPVLHDSLWVSNKVDYSNTKKESALKECLDMDFLNLGRGKGTQDYVGQRVLQILAILRNLSFFDENLQVFANNRTFLRFIVMCTNIRWGSIHNQALDIAGNVATEMDLLDPTSDELSRSLMATLCDGVEGKDRAVIINSLEIMYKLCQRDSNGDHIFKCLNLTFYKTICMFLSLNDIMLLIYTLEAIYALSSMGARFCHLIMQVRGIIDQLVSLITVEAQSYGPDGCILMRVVETVPGNMLPMVAQNIANLQNVSAVQTKHTNVTPQQSHEQQPQQSQQQLATNVDTSNSATPQQSSPAQSNGTATHEDEQYALSWLGATFDRASTVDSRVEQQELYRMYLSHCQKSGKHSVVTHTQFPRLVRLIFSTGVGPIAVKRSDGTELPGLHYVAIRLRAQPLPIQIKVNQTAPKNVDVGCSARKIKAKRQKIQSEQQHQQVNTTVTKPDNTEYPNTPIVKINNQIQIQEIPTATNVSLSVSQPTKCLPTDTATNTPQNKPTMFAPPEKTTSSVDDNVMSVALSEPSPITIQAFGSVTTNTQPSSSLIKSLLANKVTQRQQKQKELVATATAAGAQPPPIKVASTSISALVNNPLMQNTPLKVGQTTIKPLNTQTNMDKKLAIESTPPPLAPLSCSNSATVPNDNSGRPVIIANQMLVDILDKKPSDPVITSNAIKRKLDEASAMAGRDTAKRLAMETVNINETQITPSKNAANLYAEMAASILEDEDLEDIPPPITSTIKPPDHQQQPVVIPATIQATGVSLQNVQRQLVFQASQAPHLKLTQQSQQQIPTAMATIKTDQGLQTVPVILQQKPIEQQQPQLIQQVLQTNVPVSLPQPQQQTQYVLATNPQGQTYLVAQQSQTSTPPPQPTQTVLVTQTPQQQSAGTKTIIILQQQTVPSQSSQQQIGSPSPGVGQKMIMTTAQGQQVLVTQRQAATITSQPQQQFFINTHSGGATHIQHVPVSSVCSVPVSSNMQQTNTNMLQRHLIQQSNICNNPQPQSGQISPSLLSQLNHIPATIKLHNPNMQITGPSVQSHCQQQQQLGTAALSRLGKSVSIVQTAPALTTATPLQIPQLQQHQSIIQQHIISGPSEKRQVIVGGRAIEIKETVITQTQQPPPQQQQLNSQTIITTQPTLQQQKLVPQQQPQSIIQQKISVSMPQQQQQVSKTNDPVPSLIQSCVKYMPPAQQAPQISIQPSLQAAAATTKKPQIATYSKQQQSQTNIPTQNAASSTIKAVINSRPTTPVSIVTSTDVTPTISVGFFSQSQQQQDTFRCNAETKSTDMSYSAAIKPTTSVFTTSTSTTATPPSQSSVQATIDPNWLYICDWRNCPRRKFKSIQDLHHHACMSHCPDHLEPGAEIFCQWGPGPGLCDGIPRKRFSLMTHILDRHLTIENLRAAAQRRIQTGVNHALQPSQSPVTIIRNIEATQRGSTASPALSTSSSGSLPSTGSSAIHAIKRHTADFVNPKELMDENEGPVTKSIRLTASLVLRNLVTYTTNAKRSLRRHEAHLANVALSNVESSATISHILFELNN